MLSKIFWLLETQSAEEVWIRVYPICVHANPVVEECQMVSCSQQADFPFSVKLLSDLLVETLNDLTTLNVNPTCKTRRRHITSNSFTVPIFQIACHRVVHYDLPAVEYEDIVYHKHCKCNQSLYCYQLCTFTASMEVYKNLYNT